MAEEHDFQLQTVISALKDVVSRIDNLRDLSEIGSIILRFNLGPRSHSVTGNVRSGKVRFRACSVPARPEIRAFLSLRMFVLSVVILGDFCGINMDFESILEELLLGRGQENLKLKPKQKEALQRSRLFKNCRSNCRITETSA